MNEKEKKLNDLLDSLNDKLDKALALKARQKMGMSIEEAIDHGQEQLEIFGGEHKEFIETAINTMRKYQTMQEVLEKVWNVPSVMLDEAKCLNEIMETYRTVR